MGKKFEVNEIYSVHLEESQDPPFYIGELIPRDKNSPGAGYFGRTFITYDGTYTYTTGKDRNDVERKSTELVRFTLDYFIDDLKEARMFMITDEPPLTGYN